jgi:hypothetical protein
MIAVTICPHGSLTVIKLKLHLVTKDNSSIIVLTVWVAKEVRKSIKLRPYCTCLEYH